jgi:hypothetical protein
MPSRDAAGNPHRSKIAVGHKVPSGVAFRRAFLEFSVLDARDRVKLKVGSSTWTAIP